MYLPLLFQNDPVGNNDVAAIFTILDYFEDHFLADKGLGVFNPVGSHLGKGTKSTNTSSNLDFKSPLDLFFNKALNGDSILVDIFQVGLGSGIATDPRGEEFFIVSGRQEIGLYGVPLFDGGTAFIINEFLCGDGPFRFAAQIDKHPFLCNGEDHGLDFFAGIEKDRLHKTLVKQFFKAFFVFGSY